MRLYKETLYLSDTKLKERSTKYNYNVMTKYTYISHILYKMQSQKEVIKFTQINDSVMTRRALLKHQFCRSTNFGHTLCNM